jgi:hypothetical protein
MPDLEELARLLERTGLPEREALEIAMDLARDMNDIYPGGVFVSTHADVVPAMWQRARASGALSMTLKLEVDDDGYHARISVLEQAALTQQGGPTVGAEADLVGDGEHLADASEFVALAVDVTGRRRVHGRTFLQCVETPECDGELAVREGAQDGVRSVRAYRISQFLGVARL